MTSKTMQTHPRLVKMVETASGNIERIWERAHHVAAMWHYVKSNGDELVMLAPLGLDKREGVEVMRGWLEVEEAVAVLYIDEAWTVKASDQEARALVEAGLGARDHPRHVEVIHFVAEDETGQIIGIRTIERPPGEEPTLGPLEIEDSTFATGLFVGMLPRRKATLQ